MGLDLVCEYKLTSKCGDTVSDSTIKDYYDKEKKMTVTINDKQTKNSKGSYVKIFGSTFKFKEGYPPLMFDSAIIKVNEKITTVFTAFLATVTSQQHKDIFDSEVEKALKGIEYSSFKDASKIPEYIKSIPEELRGCGFNLMREGEHPEIFDKLRSVASEVYDKVLKAPPTKCPVEKIRNYLINEQSRREHSMFIHAGLSVSTKCQKAMFTIFGDEMDLEEVPPTSDVRGEFL